MNHPLDTPTNANAMIPALRFPGGLKTTIKLLIDGFVAAAAFNLALLLRFGGSLPELTVSIPTLVVVTAVWKVAVGFGAGTYRPLWRYASYRELVVVGFSSMIATAVLLLLATIGWYPVPQSVIFIDGVLFLVGVSLIRALRRAHVHLLKVRPTDQGSGGRAVFVGAGDAAHSLLAELDNRAHKDWEIVGLLDDEPSKQGASLRGHAVLGPTTELERVIAMHAITHVIVAMPSANPDILRRLVSRARSAGSKVLVAPSRRHIIQESTAAPPLRVSDLLNSKEMAQSFTVTTHDRSRPLILVTGGGGYIGTHLVRQLLESNHRVRVIDNFTYGSRGMDANRGHSELEVVRGDISSIRDTVAAVKNVDSVIALAAIVGDPACGLDAEETLNLNYESTKILVEACSFYNVHRLVFASSCSVYGASEDGLLTETSPLHPVSLYARTRILSEDVVFSRCGDVEAVVLRLSTVFGQSPRMRYDLVVNTLTARAVVEGRIAVFGGSQWRPFVHCHDAARAFLAATVAPTAHVNGQVFNVGDDSMNYRIAQVGQIVANTVGDVELHIDGDMEDPRNYRVSFAKIRERLGFTTQRSVEDGVFEMASCLRRDPSLRDFRRIEYSNVEALRQRFSLSIDRMSSADPTGANLGSNMVGSAPSGSDDASGDAHE